MFVARHNFGLVDSMKPEAIGMPGKRIFRILVDGKASAAATLWVEKEQVYGLSMAMKRMLEAPEGGEGEEKEANFPQLADRSLLRGGAPGVLEFKVGRLGLAYGPGEDHITVFFHDERDEPEGEDDEEEEGEEGEEAPVPAPSLQLCLKREQAEAFVKECLEVSASGRGTDAISRHAMVASGKVDPNRNGHFRH
ncbi:MAG: DUF3090 family protein [Candidatus Tectomicrobia bacterium]|uniref:DUF3090 family protein n=1 Tax=Tectimicrobiota bacterium TaxID=2528274 RepID=A0A932ZTI8_UNCTE|nr:DUF3090 family protein [Candidatus Tectomicrobia bacterium]